MKASLKKRLRAILNEDLTHLKAADKICALFIKQGKEPKSKLSAKGQSLEDIHGRAHNEFPCGEIAANRRVESGFRDMIDTLDALGEDDSVTLPAGLVGILMKRSARQAASTAWELAHLESPFRLMQKRPNRKQQ